MSAGKSTSADDGTPRFSRRRGILLKLHRWIGLTFGALLVLVGLAGSYLAFYPEIERATIAPLRQSPGIRPDSYEALYGALSAIAPPERGFWKIELPPDGGVITSRYAEPGQPRRLVSIDPATLEVVRDGYWGGTLSTWIYELHDHLLMGPRGATVIGLVAIALMPLIVSGLILWWRSGRSMRERLKYHRHGTGRRKIYDMHRLLGASSALLLMLALITGAALSLPDQVRPALADFSEVAPLPHPQSAPAQGRERIPLDRAMAIAREHLPGTDIRWITIPNEPRGPYVMSFWQEGEPDRRFPASQIYLDQYDGRVLAVYDSLDQSAGSRIVAWLYPLHRGEAFGLVGRAVVALFGLLPAILFTTGLLLYRSRAARR